MHSALFMHMRGHKRMHAQVPSRHFKEFLSKYRHPVDKSGNKAAHSTVKKIKNNSLFILEKKHVTITFHCVPGRRDKETTELN